MKLYKVQDIKYHNTTFIKDTPWNWDIEWNKREMSEAPAVFKSAKITFKIYRGYESV